VLQIKRPVSKENPQTGGYTKTHKGYDHDDKPDQNYYASFSGIISVAKNSETRQWQAFTNNDPYKDTRGGKLLTQDYGNYLILTGKIDGKVIKQLGAHFQPGTVLPKGTQVTAGQIIAKIGTTGNSTGTHCHTEYRDENNVNFNVEFIDETPVDTKCFLTKEQFIIDSYKALTGEYPSDSEKTARLQENKNAIEYIEDLFGNGKTKDKLLKHWGVKQSEVDKDEVIKGYKQAKEDLLGVLELPLDSDTQEVEGRARYLVQRVKELEKLQTPIYKIAGRDFEVVNILGLRLLFEKKGVKN